MLQRKRRKSNKRGSLNWSLVASIVMVALLSTSGLVVAIEASVLEDEVPLANGSASGVELASISSLEDILQVALANSPSIQIAEWELKEALAGRWEVSAALKPQLSIAGQHKVENLANSPAMVQGIVSGMEQAIRKQFPEEVANRIIEEGAIYGVVDYDDRMSTTIGSLTYYQQLRPNAQLRGIIKQAELGSEIAMLRKEQAAKDVILAVQSGYYGVLRAYDGLQLAKQARHHALLNLQTAEEKLGQGTVTPLDVLKERNACLEAENGVQGATMGVELATLALLQNMGLGNIETDAALAWAEQLASSKEISVTPWTVELNAAYAYTLEHRPELAMVRKQREMAETAYTAVKDERDWTVKLTGQYKPEDDVILQSSIDSNLALSGTAIKTKIEEPEIDLSKLGFSGGGSVGFGSGKSSSNVDPWQVELSATYRFGDGGARKAKLEAKEAAVKKAKLQEEMAKDGFYLELNTHLQQLDQAWRAYQLATEGTKAAEETLEQLCLLYELGSVTSKELREGELMLTQAQSRVLDTGLTYEANKSKVALAMGMDVEPLVQAIVQGEWNCSLEN